MENRLFELALFCPPLFYKTKYSKQNSSPLPEFFIFIFRKVKKLQQTLLFLKFLPNPKNPKKPQTFLRV